MSKINKLNNEGLCFRPVLPLNFLWKHRKTSGFVNFLEVLKENAGIKLIKIN